jgi:hypothetical protein
VFGLYLKPHYKKKKKKKKRERERETDIGRRPGLTVLICKREQTIMDSAPSKRSQGCRAKVCGGLAQHPAWSNAAHSA